MKHFVKFLLILSLFTNLNLAKIYSQNTYKDIVKAEKLFDKGNYKKALRKVDDAIKHKNCTCGSCGFEINYKTNLMRYKIYLKLLNYKQARNSLDSIYFSSEKIDSLKVAAYKIEFGEEKLKGIINSSIKNSKIECENEICFAIIPYDNNLFLKFKLSINLIDKYFYSSKKFQDNQIWNYYFLNTFGYKQL